MNDQTMENFLSQEELQVAPAAPADPKAPAGTPQPPKAPGNLVPGNPMDAGFVVCVPGENGKKKYTCNIDFFVGNAEPFFNLVHTLYCAEEGDEVTINLYSYGGSVETGCMIINAMKNTKATVRTVALGMCASIAAMIWACGQIREVADCATLMFHMPSGFLWGKTADNEEESRQIQEYFAEFMKTVAGDILTADEFTKIIDRRIDLFIPADTIKTRLAAKGGEQK